MDLLLTTNVKGQEFELEALVQEEDLTVLASSSFSPTGALHPLYLLADGLRHHVWHEPDGELADHLSGYHSLGP